MTREEAYAWLAQELDIPVYYCHIGWFDIVTCRKVVELCAPRRAEILLAEMDGYFEFSDLA